MMYFRDRFRTTINVLEDSLGAGIVNHLSKNELKKSEEICNIKNIRSCQNLLN